MDGHFNIVKYRDIHWWLLVRGRVRPSSTVLSSSILGSSEIRKCMRPISSDADSSGNCRVYNLKVQFSMVTLGFSSSLGASLLLSLKLMALHVASESSRCLFSLPFGWRLTNHFLPIVRVHDVAPIYCILAGLKSISEESSMTVKSACSSSVSVKLCSFARA